MMQNLRRKTSFGGICERCDQAKPTITLKDACGDQLDTCRECIRDDDFSEPSRHKDRIVISEYALNMMVLDIGEVLYRNDIKLWYNEDFNCLRYTFVKEFLKDWLSYEGPTHFGHTKWWELQATHPFWKDVKEPPSNSYGATSMS